MMGTNYYATIGKNPRVGQVYLFITFYTFPYSCAPQVASGPLGWYYQNTFPMRSPQGVKLQFYGVVYRPPHTPFVRGSEFLLDLVSYMHNYSTQIMFGNFKANPYSNPEDAKFVASIIADNYLFSILVGATFHSKNVDIDFNFCFCEQNGSGSLSI